MKLIVLIYLRAVRINQLKVKNWVCKYVPVLALAPAFRELKASRGETFGDSCDAEGQRRDSQAVTTVTLLHLKLTGCHTPDSWQFRVYYRGKISSKLCEVC